MTESSYRIAPMRSIGRTSIVMPKIKGDTNPAGPGIPLRYGHGTPDPSLVRQGMVVNRGNVGWLRVVIGGKDVTFFRGVPTTIDGFSEAEPFGPVSAKFFFQSISPLEDTPGTTGELDWLRGGADVEIDLIAYTNGSPTPIPLWSGIIIGAGRKSAGSATGRFGMSIEAQGALLASCDGVLAQPEVMYDTMDIGERIANLLNNIPESRHGYCRPVTTGIMTRTTGSWDSLLTGYIGDLLNTATSPDGNQQWTVALDHYRTPVIRQKNLFQTIAWTTSVGTPGVDIDVEWDATAGVTAIYGRGIDSNSQGWGNLKTPGFDTLATKHYHSFNPNDVLGIGSSGVAVTDVQTQLNNVWGINTAIDGNYGWYTAASVKTFQRGAGCIETGTVNGQTWMALFQIGQRNGQLHKAYYAPLAATPESQRYLYNASGERIGDNPAYDNHTTQRHRFHSYPDGISKTDAVTYATAELNRDKDSWSAGTITFKGVDPVEDTRFKIRAGDNIKVKNFDGGEVYFHIVQVEHTIEETTLTVDPRGRDVLTLDAIINRDREALGPGASPYIARKSILSPDKVVVDGELIGNIPTMAATGEAWNVFAVPLGTEGDIVSMKIETLLAPTRFVMAVFSARVNHNVIKSIINDPFVTFEEGDATLFPFPGNEETSRRLKEIGWIDTLGGPNNLGGYYPGNQERGGAITGKHEDTSLTLHFKSFQIPYVWLAFYPENSCFVKGNISIAPQSG